MLQGALHFPLLRLALPCALATLTAALAAQETVAEAPLPADATRPPPLETPALLPGDDLSLVPPAAGTGRALELGPPSFLRQRPLEIRPVLPPLSPLLRAQTSLNAPDGVLIEEFKFKGNHAIRSARLKKALEKFTHRRLSLAELEEARQEATLVYINAGYVNSGAVLEPQEFQHGVATLTIVEGRLTEIEVSENRWLRSWWIRHLLRRGAGQPLNVNRLKAELELLRQDPNVRQVNAELMPGGQPGESRLAVRVLENQPFRFTMEVSNRRPPSVGAEIVEVTAAMLSLTGHSDPIFFRYGPLHTDSETLDRWKFEASDNLDGSYRFPVTPWKTTLELHASRNDSGVVEEAFRALNIHSQLTQYGAVLRQPFYETVSDVFAVSAGADYRKDSTTLLDEPFSLSPGATQGETKVFALRFALEYTHRTQERVLALRSTFNVGLHAWGSTAGSSGAAESGNGSLELPDSEFFSWLGQGQLVQRLFNTDNLAVLRVNAQLANGPLLSLEQLSIGGVQSVRGYRENELLRDNGVLGSLEFHVPVWRSHDKTPILTLVPFFDIGCGWDNVVYLGAAPAGGVNRKRDTLTSVGAGLLFTPTKYVSGQLYWGYGFNREFVASDGKNLQDYGIHFALSVSVF